MSEPGASNLAEELKRLNPASPLYATEAVERLLDTARRAGASDLHLQPMPNGLLVRWRLDGVLQPIGEIPRGTAADVVSRLKVLAELLTYRTDVPQEGRIRPAALATSSAAPSADPAKRDGAAVEMRVSTFPTLHGERAVVRLFAGEAQYLHLNDLGLPAEMEQSLTQMVNETSGAILVTGPAGSGKTTTAYAALRDVVRQSHGQRSVVTLEDPIEVALSGVSQSQVQPAAGFTLATGLRSLMRQDPEVILVGEIRDAETVAAVFQAALTGHLVVSTFHAGSAAGAISRLLDMGIEPYLLTSGLRTVLHQRLLRRLCECSQAIESDGDFLGLPVNTGRRAVGCPACRQIGYRGRLIAAEMLPPLAGGLAEGVLARRDAGVLAHRARGAGMATVFERACEAVAAGQTDPAEIRRVLGFSREVAAEG